MFGNRVPLRFAIQVQLRQNYKSSNPSMARYPTSTVSFSPPSAEEWSELNGSTESTNFVKHMKNSRGNQALTGGRSKTHLSSDGMVQAIHSEFTFPPARLWLKITTLAVYTKWLRHSRYSFGRVCIRMGSNTA